MWRYDQSSGKMSREGKVFTGYAGHGRGKNNPSLQSAVGIGPIPSGLWSITGVKASANTGPFTILLEPKPGTQTFGRSAFRIHGDSIGNPGTASHGCIILRRAEREAIWRSGDRDLEVVA